MAATAFGQTQLEFQDEYFIEYDRRYSFQSRWIQDQFERLKNACMIFSLKNALNFVNFRQEQNEERWDLLLKEVNGLCGQIDCTRLEDFQFLLQSDHFNNQNYILSEFNTIAPFFEFLNLIVNGEQILNRDFGVYTMVPLNSTISNSKFGIAFLTCTFAYSILIDNQTKLIHIRDSHKHMQYTVRHLSDLFKHLLRDKYFATFERNSNEYSINKIQIVCYSNDDLRHPSYQKLKEYAINLASLSIQRIPSVQSIPSVPSIPSIQSIPSSALPSTQSTSFPSISIEEIADHIFGIIMNDHNKYMRDNHFSATLIGKELLDQLHYFSDTGYQVEKINRRELMVLVYKKLMSKFRLEYFNMNETPAKQAYGQSGGNKSDYKYDYKNKYMKYKIKYINLKRK